MPCVPWLHSYKIHPIVNNLVWCPLIFSILLPYIELDGNILFIRQLQHEGHGEDEEGYAQIVCNRVA